MLIREIGDSFVCEFWSKDVIELTIRSINVIEVNVVGLILLHDVGV